MATRFYRTVKHRYTRDDGSTLIRAQRIYRDAAGNELTPITQSFEDAAVLSPLKIAPTRIDFLRHSEATLTENQGTFRIAIPARGDNPLHKQQLQEIEALERVACQSYRGEIRDYG